MRIYAHEPHPRVPVYTLFSVFHFCRCRVAMARERLIYLLLCLVCVCDIVLSVCNDSSGRPIACYPPLETNIIANLLPVTNNTCGLNGPELVCYEDGGAGDSASTCDYCDASVSELAHPPSYMTDIDGGNLTFWQSQNLSIVQYPNSVIITFSLNKTYDISRITITFQSRRPESYAIFKLTDYGASFVPFHYYSLSCSDTYGVDEGTTVAVGDEAVALCTSEEASMTPLSGGEAVFRPLQYRPTADDFVNTQQLKEWVQATDIQLHLNRLNTLVDNTSDPDLIASNYYAISNVEIEGLCSCNGHAGSCTGSVALGDVVCECEHNTQGPDCNQCSGFYQDKPWQPATLTNPATCVACNCNNHSSVCHFEMERYLATENVSGGVCDKCKDSTDGEQCEICQFGYQPNIDVPLTNQDTCIPCPACYDQVAIEFNMTLATLTVLISDLNSSMAITGMLPADLLMEIREYQYIVQDMLLRAQNLTNQELDLTLGVGIITMDTDHLEDLIGQLAENVTLSEEGIARIMAESEPTLRLLSQLQNTLRAVEEAVRVHLIDSLTDIQDSLLDIQIQFKNLIMISLLANETSHDQYNHALSLLANTLTSLTSAQQALQLLTEAIGLQNSTSVAIETLLETHQSLDGIFINASSDLREAEENVFVVMSQANNLLSLVKNISPQDYNTTLLETRINILENLTNNLISDSVLVLTEVVTVENEVAQVIEEANVILAESKTLNLLAVELLARSHAALSFANSTVEEGNEFVTSVEVLLLQLMERLNNSQGFVTGLEEVLRNIILAEDLVEDAEGEGERRRKEIDEAFRNVQLAVEAIEEASELTMQALEVALRVREDARNTLSNATSLESKVNELAMNVTAAEERGTELEGVAIQNEEIITMATNKAEMALSDASRLETEIEELLGVLQELTVELNSTEVLPSNRLSEVGAMVTELETQADNNQIILDALQDQVDQLETSSTELRDKYTALQQHRDLLQTILNNVQQLDCRNQFQSI